MLRKYNGNRRIYNTDVAGYSRIESIYHKVLQGEPVVLCPQREDITVEILISMITLDNKRGRGPTAQQLRQFISTYTKDHAIHTASPHP